MAYDEALATRIRDLTGTALTEKKMFGGLAFLLNGNMTCGVHGNELIVRMAPDDTPSALSQPGTRPFDITGRPMNGWILVAPTAIATDHDLQRWINDAIDHAGTLKPK